MRLLFKTVIFYLFTITTVGACDSAQHRQFDFWIGRWDVFTKEGKRAGENSISLSMSNCVLKEFYKTPKGYYGESFNIYDATRKVWHQTWVDNSGLMLSLEGNWDGESMSLQGKGFDHNGLPIIHRIRWSPQDGADVHQHWETSNDQGKTWNTAFYGVYKKKKK